MLFTCYKLPCVVTIVMRFLPLTVTSLALFFLNKLRPRSLKRITALSNMALKKKQGPQAAWPAAFKCLL